MSAPATFEHFERELNRLVEQFGKHLAVYKVATYDEANVRKDFLDPFFRALGWDMDNRAGLIPKDREVEIESRTRIGGRNKRADYLSEKATLQNAVTATDHQIDALVYDLYGLTPEEIALVEGVA
jgi:hypothetical protein